MYVSLQNIQRWWEISRKPFRWLLNAIWSQICLQMKWLLSFQLEQHPLKVEQKHKDTGISIIIIIVLVGRKKNPDSPHISTGRRDVLPFDVDSWTVIHLYNHGCGSPPLPHLVAIFTGSLLRHVCIIVKRTCLLQIFAGCVDFVLYF